jgi:hypothetical protein
MNPSSKKPIFVVIYSYKFLEFIWNLYELDEFKRFVDVQVWDISPFTTPELSKGLVVGRSTRNEVVTCGSMRDYVRRLFELRRQAVDTNICVFNGVHWFLPVEALCNLFLIFILKGKNVKVFDTYNGGCPVVYPKDNENDYISQQRPGFFSKLTRFISRQTSLTQAWRSIRGAFLSRLSAIMPTVLTHRLVAGEQWLSSAMKDQRSGIRNVYCHSCDFSRYLLAEKASFSQESVGPKTAVFLSSPTPMFGGDIILSGGDHGFTSEVWYPALVRFFNFLESNTGITVEVAGHYQSAFPAIAPCFGNRSVQYGKTLELVRQSDYVITINSSAISYAVLFNKPVIIIYSNQLKHLHDFMRDQRGLAAMLGTKPINIDEWPSDICGLLKVDPERYRAYERAVLTSDPTRRPNVQIILEDIMNIDTCGAFNRDIAEEFGMSKKPS